MVAVTDFPAMFIVLVIFGHPRGSAAKTSAILSIKFEEITHGRRESSCKAPASDGRASDGCGVVSTVSDWGGLWHFFLNAGSLNDVDRQPDDIRQGLEPYVK